MKVITKLQFWAIENIIERNQHIELFPGTWMSKDNTGTYYKNDGGYIMTAIQEKGKVIRKARQELIDIIKG